MLEGIIVKGIGGMYEVETPQGRLRAPSGADCALPWIGCWWAMG